MRHLTVAYYNILLGWQIKTTDREERGLIPIQPKKTTHSPERNISSERFKQIFKLVRLQTNVFIM